MEFLLVVGLHKICQYHPTKNKSAKQTKTKFLTRNVLQNAEQSWFFPSYNIEKWDLLYATTLQRKLINRIERKIFNADVWLNSIETTKPFSMCFSKYFNPHTRTIQYLRRNRRRNGSLRICAQTGSRLSDVANVKPQSFKMKKAGIYVSWEFSLC